MTNETIDLSVEGGDTTAFVALPEGNAQSGAAVLVIQEYWGITDHIRDLAGRWADVGYISVAPDLFRGRLAKNSTEAGELMKSLELDDGVAIIKAAIAETQSRYGVERIAITGFCMGGTFALRAACELEGLSAAAPFYGDVPPDDMLSKLKVPVLFIAAVKDGWINPAKVNALKESARKFDLPIETVTYDADHAFFNDRRPEVYNPEAAADAWHRVQEFFKTRLATT